MLQRFLKINTSKIKHKEHNRQNLTYVSGTPILSKWERKQLNVFERKLYRRILGTLYNNEKELENINQ